VTTVWVTRQRPRPGELAGMAPPPADRVIAGPAPVRGGGRLHHRTEGSTFGASPADAPITPFWRSLIRTLVAGGSQSVREGTLIGACRTWPSERPTAGGDQSTELHALLSHPGSQLGEPGNRSRRRRGGTSGRRWSQAAIAGMVRFRIRAAVPPCGCCHVSRVRVGVWPRLARGWRRRVGGAWSSSSRLARSRVPHRCRGPPLPDHLIGDAGPLRRPS
jgi:hypothetical protein